MDVRISRCPSCHRPLQVTKLTCTACGLQLEGHFDRGCKFCALDPEQQRLLEVFLSCRGVIRDMEKALNLSYPTVRARVDALLSALGYGATKAEAQATESLGERRREVLDRLQSGELTPEEAAALLKDLAG